MSYVKHIVVVTFLESVGNSLDRLYVDGQLWHGQMANSRGMGVFSFASLGDVIRAADSYPVLIRKASTEVCPENWPEKLADLDIVYDDLPG